VHTTTLWIASVFSTTCMVTLVATDPGSAMATVLSVSSRRRCSRSTRARDHRRAVARTDVLLVGAVDLVDGAGRHEP
jgi:hypothetical protein